MKDIDTWLPQIVGYCEWISDPVRLRDAWIDGDFSETSVTDFDELIGQVFGDLDADRSAAAFARRLPQCAHPLAEVSTFLSSLRAVESSRAKDPILREPTALLASAQWQSVRCAALAVIKVTEGDARLR